MDTIYIILAIAVILAFFFRKELKEKFKPDPTKNLNVDHKYNWEKREREKEIDRLLGKIGKNGLGDLTEVERKRLDELSKK